MSLAVENGSELERRLTLTIGAQEVETQVDERLGRLSPRTRIKGFRPGKAPLSVIRQHYGPDVRQEVLRDLIEKRYWDSVTEQSLRPASAPSFEMQPAEPGQPLTVTAVFEVYPDFQVKGYERIPLRRPKVDITEDDLALVVEKLRRQRSHWHPVERAARTGDRLFLDYEASLADGRAFKGGAGRDVYVELGSGREIPGFEAALEGSAKDEEREFDLIFPADHLQRELAGQRAHFKVRVREVGERHLPEVDDEFCRSFGTQGPEEWFEEVRDSMHRELVEAIRLRLKQAIDDHLLEKNPVGLPRTLVEGEIRQLHRSTLEQLGLEAREEIPDTLRARYEPAARRRVALSLIYRELVRQLGLTPDPARMEALLTAVAAESENPDQLSSELRSDPRVRQDLERLALEEQLMDWLIEHGAPEEVPESFASVLNLNPARPTESNA
ncbi:MAG: trigger factor [Gammaproteobacteria bacterium]